MTKPATCAWSVGLEQRERAVQRGEDAAAVDVADHEHRQAGRAREAHVARSRARRLISAGLPAPSQTTTSKRARRSASALEHDGAQLGLELLVERASASAYGRPMSMTWLWRSPRA